MNTTKKQISILGCGWLGLDLAKSLIEDGFEINGSTTTPTKIEVLKNNNINPFLISLTEENVGGNFEDFLQSSSILIINIPPRLRGNFKENFVMKIKNILPYIEKSTLKKVLFVSSTSVYGQSDQIITEETPTKPETESGRQLLEVEQLLQANTYFETTILRFGGLIDDDRHPVTSLIKKGIIANPDSPVNLIHRQDCIGIIKKIIALDIWQETLNAVTPYHPNRKEYYSLQAKKFGLESPVFEVHTSNFGKNISSQKLQDVLQYTFVKDAL